MGHMKKLGKLDHLFFTLTNFKYSYQFPSSLVHIILQNHEAHVCVLWGKERGNDNRLFVGEVASVNGYASLYNYLYKI